MRSGVLVGVWAYMLLSLAAEVASFYLLHTLYVVTAVITILAASQAASVVLFYMELKDEPGSLKIFAIIPLMFMSALLIAMMASLA